MARRKTTSRITPKGTRPANAQVQRESASAAVQQSPPWFGWMIAALLGLGTAVIVANYMSWIPWSPHSGWIGVGLVVVLVGILLATRWK